MVSFVNVLRESPVDIRILWLSSFLRLLAFGLSNLILISFFNLIGFSKGQIGLFMSLTLLGDTIISYHLTSHADCIGRRKIIVVGSLLMCFSGITFIFSENYYLLLIASVLGVISPTGDEIGPFKSIEESIIAHLTPHHQRPQIYALHWLISCIGSSAGTLLCGILLLFFKIKNIGQLKSYKLIFGFYSILAFVKGISMAFLSDESDKNGPFGLEDGQQTAEHNDDGTDTGGIGSMIETVEELEVNEQTSLLARGENLNKDHDFNKGTMTILSRLLIIFMFDSFGMGFLPSTWIIYYFKTKFEMSAWNLSVLFAVCIFLNSVSSLPSSAFAVKLGPVKSILVFQVSSALFLLAIPLFSERFVSLDDRFLGNSHFWICSLFLIAFYTTSAMDVVPRQIILTNLIPSRDLTKSMGIVNIAKTLARTCGPFFAGQLLNLDHFWVCFIVAGGFVILADTCLYFMFFHLNDHLKRQLQAMNS